MGEGMTDFLIGLAVISAYCMVGTGVGINTFALRDLRRGQR